MAAPTPNFSVLLEAIRELKNEIFDDLSDMSTGRDDDLISIHYLIERKFALDGIEALIRAEAVRLTENITDEESAPKHP